MRPSACCSWPGRLSSSWPSAPTGCCARRTPPLRPASWSTTSVGWIRSAATGHRSRFATICTHTCMYCSRWRACFSFRGRSSSPGPASAARPWWRWASSSGYSRSACCTPGASGSCAGPDPAAHAPRRAVVSDRPVRYPRAQRRVRHRGDPRRPGRRARGTLAPVIGIPVELGWLAWTVRPYWPDADEDALRRCAQAWRAAADGLRGVLPDADRAGGGAVSALDGPTADAVRAVWDGFTVGDDGHIEVLASACAGLAGVCDGTADVVERAKHQLVRAVLALAGELTVLAAIAPATAGLSLLAGAVAARATRDRAHDIATRAADAVARTVERSGAGDRLGHLGTVLRARRIPHPGGGPTVRPDLGAGPGGLLGVDGRSDPPPLAGSDPADIRPRSTLAGHAVPSPPAVVGLAPAAGPPPGAGGSAVSGAGAAGSGPGLPGSPAVVPASTGPAGRSQGALAPSTGSAAPSGPGANRPGPARADPSRPAA